jgi:hypothetical protein
LAFSVGVCDNLCAAVRMQCMFPKLNFTSFY